MNSVIAEKLKNIPTKSGVYLMRSDDGTVIYVGKAKNLKNRVSQYFINNNKPQKVRAMVEKIEDFDYFITLSELDALGLESNLIKKYQPFYNILLKDGKAFPYIKIDLKQNFPKFEIVRKLRNDGCKYFGPYISGVDPRELLSIIFSAFPLRTCNIELGKKIKDRACLNFSLGLCSAPCIGNVSAVEYKKIVDEAMEFLKGNDTLVEQILKEKMEIASEQENFEYALKLRDQIKIVHKLKEKVIANIPKDVSYDVFGYDTDGFNSAICVITVRNGRILGVNKYSVVLSLTNEDEVLGDFVLEYYKRMELPEEILVSSPVKDAAVIEKYFKESKGKTCDIISPSIAYKKHLVDMAKENAREHFEKFINLEKVKRDKTFGAMEKLKQIFNLTELPVRIECYDISNINGAFKVASMSVAINGEKSSKNYRKFKIKTIEGINDFASLQETLSRRFKELQAGKDASFSQRPNLILIDGGKGQLSACNEILKEFGLNIAILSLAEKFDEVFVPEKSTPVMLKRGSSELMLLQGLRDEAHRFAITFHKQLRDKNTFSDPLDKIEGIGMVKRRALYSQFITLEQIKNASAEELNLVKGIDKKLAINIYNYFHKGEK